MKENILFLVRAYNDFDHFAPIMWKARLEGFEVNYIFVDKWCADDYRTRLCASVGVKRYRSIGLDWFSRVVRKNVRSGILARILDIFVGMPIGISILLRVRASILVTEWCGPSGRGMARYLLVPARVFRIPTFSLPHGYYIWRNRLINFDMLELGENHRKFDFSDRNRFYSTVVQSINCKNYFRARKVKSEKLEVLGSARFCQEWVDMNLEAAMKSENARDSDSQKPRILFFLGNWSYRVRKNECLSLLNRLSKLQEVNIVVKGHTRGEDVGGLEKSELQSSSEISNLIYADERSHSNVLIARSVGVINFGSSIGLEAILQGKPVCNPCYLTENETIFTGSGMVKDAHCDEDVLDFVSKAASGQVVCAASSTQREEFLKEHVYGGIEARDVLGDHIRMFRLAIQ